jgi:uncharacterized membrane protein YeiH
MMQGQFALPIDFDLVAILVVGVTGALAAMKRGYDVVGLFALTFVTALGGALIRDAVFLQQGPPALTTDSRYILAVLLAGFTGMLLGERIERFGAWIAWLDAIGLGTYGVVGVQKSLAAGLSIGAAILVGVVNAVGGGLLRDVLVREEPLVFRPGQFYVLAALAGCALFPLLTLKTPLNAWHAAIASILFTFVVRILSYHFNWRTGAISRKTAPPTPPPETRH